MSANENQEELHLFVEIAAPPHTSAAVLGFSKDATPMDLVTVEKRSAFGNQLRMSVLSPSRQRVEMDLSALFDQATCAHYAVTVESRSGVGGAVLYFYESGGVISLAVRASGETDHASPVEPFVEFDADTVQLSSSKPESAAAIILALISRRKNENRSRRSDSSNNAHLADEWFIYILPQSVFLERWSDASLVVKRLMVAAEQASRPRGVFTVKDALSLPPWNFGPLRKNETEDSQETRLSSIVVGHQPIDDQKEEEAREKEECSIKQNLRNNALVNEAVAELVKNLHFDFRTLNGRMDRIEEQQLDVLSQVSQLRNAIPKGSMLFQQRQSALLERKIQVLAQELSELRHQFIDIVPRLEVGGVCRSNKHDGARTLLGKTQTLFTSSPESPLDAVDFFLCSVKNFENATCSLGDCARGLQLALHFPSSLLNAEPVTPLDCRHAAQRELLKGITTTGAMQIIHQAEVLSANLSQLWNVDCANH